MRDAETMKMPPDFPYRGVVLKGKQEHGEADTFCARHPKMDIGKRAKIFAPFDALKGFAEEVAFRNEIYTERVYPGEDAQAEIDRCLRELVGLASGRRGEAAGRVRAEVTFFVLCSDPHSEAYGVRGQYHTVCGLFKGVDAEGAGVLFLERYRIPLKDIIKIAVKYE